MKVILTKAISFSAEEKLININAGQTVFVDMKNQVAYYDGVHFIIDRSEYSLVN